MTCNVAFIGLGVMGYPMAGYISKAGHNVTVFNRTKSKAEKWIGEYKGKMANTPAEAADGADFIFTCVGNDDDLREVATGENGLFNTAKAGSIFIDNSTVSAEVSRELNKPRKKLCPKLEKNVKIKPNRITFKLKLLNIDKNYDL